MIIVLWCFVFIVQGMFKIYETDIENKTAYEYWNAFTNQWIKGNENEATVLIEDKVG